MKRNYYVPKEKTKVKEEVICNCCIKSSLDSDLTIYDFYIVDKGSYQTIYCNKCAELSEILIIRPYKNKKKIR